MAAHATQPSMPISSSAPTLRVPRRIRKPAFGAAQRLRAWKVLTAGLAAVSLAGIAALLAGLDSAPVAIVAAATAAASGLVAYLFPLPR